MRTSSLFRRAAVAVVATLTLAACGGDDSKSTTGGSSPTSADGTDTTSGSPADTTLTSDVSPADTAAAPAVDECYGAVSAASLGAIAGPGATPLSPVIEPFQDTSRGTVVCYQQFMTAPDAGLGDTDAYLGVTMADSSRYLDTYGETVTIDTYKAVALEPTPLSIGDEALSWGQSDDTDYQHYRYVAFKKGDLVVMVYAGFEPYQPATDWVTADALLLQWATAVAEQIAASSFTAADLPEQEVVVPVTTAPQP